MEEIGDDDSVTLLSPAGARAVTSYMMVLSLLRTKLLSPAGARVVTYLKKLEEIGDAVAVPRRGASCYQKTSNLLSMKARCCPPQGRELLPLDDH